MKLISTLVLLFCVQLSLAQAFLFPTNPPPQVALAWNPVPGATNYFVYYGIGSGQYTNKTATGNQTNLSITLPARGPTYFFAATAQSNGLESSGFSNEVNYSPALPPAAPTLKPVVVLTVQYKPINPAGALWADAGMNWSFPPDNPSMFRLKISGFPADLPLVTRTRLLPRSLPPLPY